MEKKLRTNRKVGNIHVPDVLHIKNKMKMGEKEEGRQTVEREREERKVLIFRKEELNCESMS